MTLADSAQVTRKSKAIFYAFDMRDQATILGRPWRHQHAVVVNAKDDSWTYGSQDGPEGVLVREPWEFLRDLRGERHVYAVSIRAAVETPAPLPPEFADFDDVFEYDPATARRVPAGVHHAIELEPGKKPPFKPLYHQSSTELESLKAYIGKALENG